MKSSPGKTHGDDIRLELKYCERCGGLWLRKNGAGHVYCERCLPEMAELPAPKKLPDTARLPGSRRPERDDLEYPFDELDDIQAQAARGAA